MARSDKYRAMLESHMKESIVNKIDINDPDLNMEIYRYLIEWIYEGECDLNGCPVRDMLILLKLTDEYLLNDFQKVCEEQIIDTMDGISALEILTDNELIIP